MRKLSQEVSASIVETQDIVLRNLSLEGQKIDLPSWITNVKTIANTSEDTMKSVLGKTGQRLHRFAVRVNCDHPDIESYFDVLGKPAVVAFEEAVNLLKPALSIEDTERHQQFNADQDLLENGSIEAKKMFSYFDAPRPRLLSSSEDRSNQRSVKKHCRSIGLKTLSLGPWGGENNFYCRPDNFKRFACGSDYRHVEMQELQNRYNFFASIHMTEMANVYTKRMRELEESLSQTLGFYRIKPDEASIILARLHGFKWSELGFISISSRFFEGCHFWSEGATVEEDKTEALKKSLILNTRFVPASFGSVFFNYQPRIYPFNTWAGRVVVPDNVKKIMDRTEKFSKLNDSPFFDYYWVLVPGINPTNPLIQKTAGNFTVHENNTNMTYTNQNDAALAIDSLLVKEGYLVPIVIGERDGNSYFVSMWA